jgi:orotidine-5'-phosphate decarboxylase
MQERSPEQKILIALDVGSLEQATAVVQAVGERAVGYKVGSELFTRCGPAAVRFLTERGKEVFLDLKFHDIPNTVAGAVGAAAELGVRMLNVHASGGMEMMKAAARAAHASASRPRVLAVTVLTSIDQPILSEEVGCNRIVEEQVLHLARLACGAGLDGVVASPKEIAIIRENVGPDCLIVTPGIRPAWAARGDQRRVMTPAEAIRAGADYLVIGRPITGSSDPRDALERVIAEILQSDS